MKNTAMACLILILAGCTVAPTNGVQSHLLRHRRQSFLQRKLNQLLKY